jgi:heat shock protein HtpX
VAVSVGLLEKMDADEVQGVLGHEVTHIANGDMVTMTLLQGVINAVVMIAARLIAQVVTSAGSRDNERTSSPFLYMTVVYLLQFVMSILGAIVVNYFSRAREFRADAGGARLAGREKMIHALKRLQSTVQMVEPDQQALQTLKISGGRRGDLLYALFATHPPLEERIRRLESSASTI